MASRVNSKAKGSRFERVVCKSFESWSGYEFSRTPSSGGLRWKKTDNISSDVVCSDPSHSRKFPFSVEVKNYKDIKFEHLLLGNRACKIHNFWNQANRDADRANKIPILIMRYNSMPKGEAFFCVGRELTKWLTENYQIRFMVVNIPNIEMGIFMFKEIQNIVTYRDIYKYARKLVK